MGPDITIPLISGILDNLSQLYKAGYKVSLFKQALFFNIDGFYQTRIEAPNQHERTTSAGSLAWS